MKVNVKSLDSEEEKQVELSTIFKGEIRPDIIKQAVLSAQSSRKQPKGSDPRAGMETTAETPPKGSGQTRVRRIQGRGYQAAGRSAWAPFTYDGRRAHPPKSEEKQGEEINKKEKDIAIKSAISATKNLNMVSDRGHAVDEIEGLPLIVDDKFEEIKKTRKVKEVLENLGVWKDVKRVKEGRKVRSGKGKARGRPYKKKTGPLIVVNEDKGIIRGSRNIPGVDVITVDKINTEIFAPGGSPGRLTIWTESAIEEVDRRFSN